MATTAPPRLRYGTSPARWVLLVTVLGSGVAFLDSTVVNVALPAIGREFHAGLSDLQWTLDAYLLTLGSLIVIGGSLGDLYGRRRVFVIGLVGFSVASLACGLAPAAPVLILARAAQGVFGALLVPASLAVLSATVRPEDRGRAVGAWSGLGGVWTALGPFLGGWLVDAVSWRLVFLINVPVVAFTAWAALRHVPETRDEDAVRHLDLPGALSIAVGLAGVVYALIEGPAHGFGPVPIAALVSGVLALALFPLIEARSPNPMVPLEMFGSRQFSGANATTFAVYGAMGTATFLFVVHLQRDLGYTALESGVAFLPAMAVMTALSAQAGRLAQRIGPRLPMTIGPVVAGAGLALMGRVAPGDSYLTGVLPSVLVFGAGMTLTVAPLTSAVLSAVEDRHLGVGSAVNNAVARIASLLSVAILPAAAGLARATTAAEFQSGYTLALTLSAVLCAAGGLVALVTIRPGGALLVRPAPHVHPSHACGDPALCEGDTAVQRSGPAEA
ncbi:MAG TPA: MFS transporter [Candidatus Dormibacteraeota bacterium]|nr:MFS transporter [Candidatus Dormibacteraeota bacterium]